MGLHNDSANDYQLFNTGSQTIADPGSGGTFDLRGIDRGVATIASGTRVLPNGIPLGVSIFVKATGSVTITDAAATTIAILSSGQVLRFQSAGSNAWFSSQAIIDAGAYTSATTIETALQRLMRDTQEVHVDLTSALDADGDPLAKFADNASPNPGFTLANSEAFGIRWNNNATQNQPVLLSTWIPRSFDGTDSVLTCHVVASKIGATVGDATTFTITAYNQVVGILHDGGANLGGTTSAMTGNAATKTVQRVTLTMTNANTPFGSNTASPTKLTLSVTPTSGTLGTDDVIIHDIYFTWTSVR